TQRLLVSHVRNVGEVASQLETHPLAGTDSPFTFLFEPVEEIADRDAEYLRDFEQATGGNPVYAPLVFVRLLIGDPDQIGQLLLGQAKHDPPLANASADMPID